VQYHNGQSEAFINPLNSVQNAFWGEPTPIKGVIQGMGNDLSRL